MVCLDTDILVGLLRNDRDAIKKVSGLEGSEIISTTPLNATELFKGAYRSKYRFGNVELIQKLLNNIEILTYDLNSSKLTGQIIEGLRRSGDTIGDIDCIIAGITIAHNEKLISRNIKHFCRVPDLRVEKW